MPVGRHYTETWPPQSILYAARHRFGRIMHSWIIDYHHALLIRLIGLVALLGVVFVFHLLARQVWQIGSSRMRHLEQRFPVRGDQKL